MGSLLERACLQAAGGLLLSPLWAPGFSQRHAHPATPSPEPRVRVTPSGLQLFLQLLLL